MPKQEILQNYARLLVRTGCALKPGQELLLTAPVEAAPFARLVAGEAWNAGAGDVIVEWADQPVSRLRYLHADAKAFESVPEWKRPLLNGAAERGAAILTLDGDDPDGMAGIDPARFTAWSRASHRDCKPFYGGMDLGRNVWCIAGAATPAWAKKVFPNLPESEATEKLWDAILYTARADGADPARAWADHSAAFRSRIKRLNKKGQRHRLPRWDESLPHLGRRGRRDGGRHLVLPQHAHRGDLHLPPPGPGRRRRPLRPAPQLPGRDDRGLLDPI